MKNLDALWNRELDPGLYHFSVRRNPKPMLELAGSQGFRCFYLNGLEIGNKAEFLAACAQAMSFPESFGHNWDALADSIEDLSWVPADAYILFYDRAEIFAADHPKDWLVARDILNKAVASWQARGVPFYVLLRGAAATERMPRYPTS